MEVCVEHKPGRFFARLGDEEAEVLYVRTAGVLDVRHTFTPPSLRGHDVAAHLTAAAFAYAEAEGLRVVPTCSYTRAYLERHPELRRPAADPGA